MVRELGKGAMGIVYLGRDPVIGRLVALKTIRVAVDDDAEMREFSERFLREAQAAGILSHPNIVTVHDVGEDPGTKTTFIAMEYVEGKNLKQLLQEKTPYPFERVAEIIGQVAEALDYAHRKGIVHRDVKPANIIITPEGQVKITDFGIAKIEKSNLTSTGQFLGTPNYMSPEQVTGETVDGRSDLFSLGVVLYELLTRKKPFTGENLTSISYKIVHESFTPPETYDAALPPEFGPILQKALAKDPAVRFQRGNDFALSLYEFKARQEEREMLRDLGKMIGEAERLGPVSTLDVAPPTFPSPSGSSPGFVPPASAAYTPRPSSPALPIPGEVPRGVTPTPPPAPLPPSMSLTGDGGTVRLEMPLTTLPIGSPMISRPLGEDFELDVPSPRPAAEARRGFSPAEPPAPASGDRTVDRPRVPRMTTPAPRPTPPPPPAEVDVTTPGAEVMMDGLTERMTAVGFNPPSPPSRPASPPPAARYPSPPPRPQVPAAAPVPPGVPPAAPVAVSREYEPTHRYEAITLPKEEPKEAPKGGFDEDYRPTEVIVDAAKLAALGMPKPAAASARPPAPPAPGSAPPPPSAPRAVPPALARPIGSGEVPVPSVPSAEMPRAPQMPVKSGAVAAPSAPALKRHVNPTYVWVIVGSLVLIAGLVVAYFMTRTQQIQPTAPVDDTHAIEMKERAELLRKGDAAFKEQRYEEALASYQELIRRDPGSVPAREAVQRAEPLAKQQATEREEKAKAQAELDQRLVTLREASMAADDALVIQAGDAVLGLDPANQEAQQLKAAASERLAKKSDEERKKALEEAKKKIKPTPTPRPTAIPVVVRPTDVPVPPTPTPTTANVKVVFQSPFSKGLLMFSVGAASPTRKDFDFGKNASGGTVESSLSAPAGEADFKVWIFPTDRQGKPPYHKVQSLTFPGGETRTIRVEVDAASGNISIR
ncbi:MAG: protein kinase [Acidobacteria bacterium]|nr:protein kinase [Acidobacteriota bacterium]